MRVELANGGEAIVDPEYYELVSVYNWRRWDTTATSYAISSSGQFGRAIYMHRVIAGAPHGQVVHHLNGNGLDNRLTNLHLGTQQENLAAIGPQPNNSSGYKGVRHAGRALTKPWIARIKVDRRTLHIGYYATAEEAALAYNKEALLRFGDLAYQNEVA